ncbi:hypothetical protein ACVWXN_003227 [Bradyrhizobium sp. i1.4.4]
MLKVISCFVIAKAGSPVCSMRLTGAKQVALSNKETQFKKGKSGNPEGRPKGSHSLDTRVRRIFEGDEELPPAIAKVIKRAVGADKKPLQATIIVGRLQALQGDDKWAKLLWERGFGKVPDIVAGDHEQPVAQTFTLKIDNS